MGKFRPPENFDKIRTFKDGTELWAGANDWESGWTSAAVFPKGANGRDGAVPLRWTDVSHAGCPGCKGSLNEPHRKAGRVCYDWGQKQVEAWARGEGTKREKAADAKLSTREAPMEGTPAHDKVLEDARSYHEKFGAKYGLPAFNPKPSTITLDKEKGRLTGAAFDKMKHDPDHPEVKAAYDALKREIADQYDHLVSRGVKFSRWTKEGQPYKDSKEMRADAVNNRHLHYFPTEGGFGSTEAKPDDPGRTHPLNEDAPGHPPGTKYNDLFRAVHDYYGHAVHGHQFGPQGEVRAWHEHARMLSPLARKALTTETHGQNSWVNFGPHNPQALKPTERPFADQKANILSDHETLKPETPEKLSARGGAGEGELHQLIRAAHAARGDRTSLGALGDHIQENNRPGGRILSAASEHDPVRDEDDARVRHIDAVADGVSYQHQPGVWGGTHVFGLRQPDAPSGTGNLYVGHTLGVGALHTRASVAPAVRVKSKRHLADLLGDHHPDEAESVHRQIQRTGVGRELYSKLPDDHTNREAGPDAKLARVTATQPGLARAVGSQGSSQHDKRLELARRIFRAGGVKARVLQVLAHTEAGDRPAVAAVAHAANPVHAAYVAANVGMVTQEPGLVLFAPDSSGSDRLHVWDSPHPISHVAKVLRAAGLTSFATHEHKGGTRAFAVNPPGDPAVHARAVDATKHFATRGRADRIGTGEGGTARTTAEQRNARKGYRDTIAAGEQAAGGE